VRFYRPVLPDIRAGRLLAHRAEIIFADDLERLVIDGQGRCLNPDPGRPSLDRIIRLLRLFRVTGAAVSRYRLN
jgi:hypothetical protein